MNPKVIRTEADYMAALTRIDALMDAEIGTAEGEELDLWVTLVRVYEDKAHPIGLPDPVEAIKFRMDQAGLSRRDLVPYLGSPSRVSEVLSGKRPLSLDMMRRLHTGLGIPASVLLQRPNAELPQGGSGIEWTRFPVVELKKRGWIDFRGSSRALREHAEDVMRAFIRPFDEELELPMCARQHVRDGGNMDAYALCAWKIRIMHEASKHAISPYEPGTVTQDFIRETVRLSYLSEGPRLAGEYLAKNGIHLIVEGHLSKTYLDGAALLMPDGRPLVGLTLRYDRLDNFWFTLAHELAHVALHLDSEHSVFFDDLEAGDNSRQETEADRLAAEALIPRTAWETARLTARSPAAAVVTFANQLRISPAIPAGRIRHEARNHRLYWNLVGGRGVRSMFAVSLSDSREFAGPSRLR